MEIIRIATSGSVDDGKSTLIGRLLYETGQVAKDKMEHIEASSKKRGLQFTDLSLLTDGLIAEREQGITIDVAHIYFQTSQRKYIIADTPGHVEYTRNMVTGASTADATIVLLDASKGIQEQTKRHLKVSNLLEIPNVIFAINKMDLVQYDEATFIEFKLKLEALAESINLKGKTHFIPMSALEGEGVTKFSDKIAWNNGPSLLEILETVTAKSEMSQSNSLCFQVQTVIRPKSGEFREYRGYSGRLFSGELKVGDEIVVSPSRTKARITHIEKWGTELEATGPSKAVTLRLDRDIDCSRGDIILDVQDNRTITKDWESNVCWMDQKELIPGGKYILQNGTASMRVKVSEIRNENQDNQLRINEFGTIRFKSSQPFPHLPFQEIGEAGAFILVDESTLQTSGVGFVR